MLRSESADEEALLQGATCLGWRLLLRTKDTIVIQEGFPSIRADTIDQSETKGVHKFELLEELSFSSARQRMTVIVRDTWDQKVCLYCKGADSKVISLSCDEDLLFPWFCQIIMIHRTESGSIRGSSKGEEDLVELERAELLKRIAQFSQERSEEGYRLLVVGGKYVTESELASWRKELDKAKKAMKQRDEVGF